MSDFYQQGLICTLQNLRGAVPADSGLQAGERFDDPVSLGLERKLEESNRKIALVLPCHYSELGQPALELLLREVGSMRFLSEVVVSMNGMDQAGAISAANYFKRLPHPHRVLWNDSPQFRQLLESIGLPFASGKGFNLWSACGVILQEGTASLIVAQDCDVTSFRREMLVRLCAACALEDFGYDFAKLYYSRFTHRINGRVSRLFLAPLLRSLVRVVGHHPLLDFLLSFRYPLAGELAMRRELAASLVFPTGWDLEIGLICEVFRHADPRQVCQVDAGIAYEHKHQPLGGLDSGLLKMSREIAATLFGYLGEEGIKVDASFHGAVRAIFPREASEAVRRYRNLALINGLEAFSDQEQIGAEAFAQMLQRPEPTPRAFLPSWNQFSSAEWREQFVRTVAVAG
jgi:glucosyl-3-phosphoglycerate synthase